MTPQCLQVIIIRAAGELEPHHYGKPKTALDKIAELLQNHVEFSVRYE